MNLWEELLVLQARFEERSSVRSVGEPDSSDSLESLIWTEAYELLNEVIKRHTRVKPPMGMQSRSDG
jgi:hypothetical protein